MHKYYPWIPIIVIILIISLICVYCYVIKYHTITVDNVDNVKNVETFTNNKDTKLDPIMDPAYNMKEVCKQSVLLEEHLMNQKKRCSDCITKHFLLITGYVEEAVGLATNEIDKYPFMKESCKIYNDLFKKWLEVKKAGMDEKSILDIAHELRIRRKILVNEYINK